MSGRKSQRAARVIAVLATVFAVCIGVVAAHAVTSSSSSNKSSNQAAGTAVLGVTLPVSTDTASLDPTDVETSDVPIAASKSIGVEGSPTAVAPVCSIISAAQVGLSFAGSAAVATVTTSATNNQECDFTITGSNVGTVALSLSTRLKVSPTEFLLGQNQSAGEPLTGVADTAYYLANTSNLFLMKGTTVVALQGVLATGAGTKYAGQTRADLIDLARRVALQL